jgi:hypothetical protein
MIRGIVCLVIGFTTAAGPQRVDDDCNTSCVERLEIPAYPALADAARVSGIVTAAIKLGSGGAVQTVTCDVRGGKGLVRDPFMASVEKSVRASRFATACNGRTVRLIFEFSLGEHVGRERVAFSFPNHFSILTILTPARVIQ